VPARLRLHQLVRKHPRFEDPSTLLADRVLSAHVAIATDYLDECTVPSKIEDLISLENYPSTEKQAR
jgi:hypothetical protein